MRTVVFFMIIGLCTICGQMSNNPLIKALDIENILKDSDRRNNIISCFLNGTNCDIITRNIKNMIPVAIKTKCEKCPIELQTQALKFFNYLQRNDSVNWTKFLEKYDPSGKGVKDFMAHMFNQTKNSE